jgi:hypothetical protein
MSRISRLHALKSGGNNSVKGESRNQSTLDYWSNRANKNSYHGKPSGETGTDRLGTMDKNHVGGTFEPKVRREG